VPVWALDHPHRKKWDVGASVSSRTLGAIRPRMARSATHCDIELAAAEIERWGWRQFQRSLTKPHCRSWWPFGDMPRPFPRRVRWSVIVTRLRGSASARLRSNNAESAGTVAASHRRVWWISNALVSSLCSPAWMGCSVSRIPTMVRFFRLRASLVAAPGAIGGPA